MYSSEFLKALDSQKTKVVYARISSLTFSESPVESIEGRVTQGSINIDGASALRRTCSLTLIAKDVNINDYYWGLNTKFKLEIGLRNYIDSKYPEIIWFNQGVYLITTFTCSLATNKYTISISGKDKMALLNGEIGGVLNSTVDFGQYEETDEEGITTIKYYPIKDIIRDSVHQYGMEPFNNIIINDVDDLGLELLEYRYDEPLYLLRESGDDTYFNGTFDKDFSCWLLDGTKTTISELENYDSLVDAFYNPDNPTYILLEENGKTSYCVAKIEYGDTAGYRTTDLTYAGELIGNVGESLTSILDKIRDMLGEFEYFYDINGRFVFQKKKTYANMTWSPTVSNEDEADYVESLATSSASTYTFSGGELISAINNSPNLSNVKNDFSIWGTRKSTTGQELPVHLRYAIDKKPEYYKTFDGVEYSADVYDWRELIYQMSLDYRKHNHDDDFEVTLAKNNFDYYPTGQTGYEQYYIDLEGFWRQLYKPELEDGDEEEFYTTEEENAGWARAVYEAPETLDFWFDFLDQGGELEQFSIFMIGDRPKAVNESSVKSIYFRETPMIIFTDGNSEEERRTGYRYFQAGNLENMFSLSTQGVSAKDKLDDFIYTYAYCAETITITSVPIYYLEPNTRIQVHDEDTGIDGDYIINRMTIPLTYNGTMSITANKAVSRM